MLRLEKVSVDYGSVRAMDGVDLALADGQVLALLGPSGCGKSTLLRAVVGLEPLTAGRITWDGADLASVPVHRRRFGLMFQDGVLFPHRTVGGNVGYGLVHTGRTKAQIRDRVAEMLELVGLPGYAERPVGTLSGGQAQRVALARALAPQPRLLLLDEPLAALDRALRERLLADLRAVLTGTGTTALFVTHDQGEAFAIADQVAVMDRGRIRQTGTPQALWRSPTDAWVARFVGYTSVLAGESDGSATRCAAGVVPGVGDAVALRPSALVIDPAGPLSGICRAVVPGPDVTRLTVELAGVGEVVATTTSVPPPEVGAPVRLRFDPAGAAVLPGPGDVAGSAMRQS